MYELYEQMMEAFKLNDEGLFVARARNFIAARSENPFPLGTPAADLYFSAAKAFDFWQKRTINYRNSKKQMVEFLRKLAAMDLPNPYKVNENVEEKHEEITEIKEEEKNIEYVPAVTTPIETIHVLGVVPEEIVVTEEKHEEVQAEEEKTEPIVAAEEKKDDMPVKKHEQTAEKKPQNNYNDKHQFFGKKKK